MITKEETLEKMKEWSRENNSKTPSEKVFFEYAEIGIHDLKKLGWSHYGALVQEAGLKPNKFDKTKYNKTGLCVLFVGTIREKNKWPTRGELDVKHFQDPNFPNYGTFVNQLGLTGDLAQSILDFIKDKKGFEDIEDICVPIIEKYKNDQITNNAGKTVEQVYMYKYKNQSQPIKVGRSNDVFTRGIQLAAGGHDKLELLHFIKTDDPIGVEQYWHNRFRQLGREEQANEWFKLKPEDVKAFKR
jgi:hypothetical protein